jgi:transposase
MKANKATRNGSEIIYAGIDAHKSQSVNYLMNEEEQRISSGRILTNREEMSEFFKSHIEGGNKIRAAVETGNLTFWLCDILHELGIETYVVNTLANKAISESSKKTDKRDARTLALQLKKGMLPDQVYEPPPAERELRSLVKHREQLKKNRCRVVNQTHALLSRWGIIVKKNDLSGSYKYWHELLKNPILSKDSVIQDEFKFYMSYYMFISNQMKAVEKQMVEKSKEINSEYYDLLIDHPGVGPVIAPVIIAYCNGVERFKNCRRFNTYHGLTPKVRESGDKKKGYSMPLNKRGVSIIRGYMTQAALAVLRSKTPESEPFKAYYERIRVKKGWQKARIALARKISMTIFGMLKNKTPFNPEMVTART